MHHSACVTWHQNKNTTTINANVCSTSKGLGISDGVVRALSDELVAQVAQLPQYMYIAMRRNVYRSIPRTLGGPIAVYI